MVDFEAVKDFIEYVTYEDNDLPYGGLVSDAPQKAKDAYKKYVDMLKRAEAEGVII